MKKWPNIILFFLLGFFALGISSYALYFLVPEMQFGLLDGKSSQLLDNKIWRTSLSTHIFAGAIALSIGWVQFINGFRTRYLKLHRLIGKVYMISVLLSGISGAYVALFATGGWISVWGFLSLAIIWLITNIRGYQFIKKADVLEHNKWMYRNYALTFAAVTLRLWLPLFLNFFEWPFIPSYRAISFLCWVPNLLLAEWLIKKYLPSS